MNEQHERAEAVEALPLPNGHVAVVGFRVAEEPGRIPVDVRCLCGQAVSFRHIFVLEAHTSWSEGACEGLCPACRRPLRVAVRVAVEATVIGRAEPPADAVCSVAVGPTEEETEDSGNA